MPSIGIAGAILGGILTLLSPCSAILLPAFFANAFGATKTIITRCGLFILGLMTTLIPMGLFAGTIGGLFRNYRTELILVTAVLLISLGLIQILGVPLPALGQYRTASTTGLSMYLLGLVYVIAGICAGPILGAVLTVAAAGGSAIYGGLLLAAYALGMGIPLLVLSLLWRPLGDKLQNWLRPRELKIGSWRNSWISLISGVISLAIGLFLGIFGDGLQGIQFLDATEQAKLEDNALTISAGISDVLTVLAIAIIAILAVAYAGYRNAKTPRNIE